MNRLTLGQSLRGVRLALWDEDQGRLVSFAEAQPAGTCSTPQTGVLL